MLADGRDEAIYGRCFRGYKNASKTSEYPENWTSGVLTAVPPKIHLF